MPPRKKSTGQMSPRKSPGKKLPTYNGFWKRIPLENAFEQNTLEIFLLGKCPRGQNVQEIFPLRKKTLGKMPTKKKGLLKNAFAKYTFKTWNKAQEKIAPPQEKVL